MKILLLTNVFPPHHGGTFDFRCESTTNALRQRGHHIRVLCSTHGLTSEQRDHEIERRLQINGAFGHPLVTDFEPLKAMEIHNNQVLSETIAEFQPELIYVWSLRGISKSLVFQLRNSRLPVVYDVADDWIAEGLRTDPWLSWWNGEDSGFKRSSLELMGTRRRLDRVAPTRLAVGYDRIPEIYGSPETLAKVQPNSIGAFRFDRLYFCSEALKVKTENRGFRVNHAEVIHPGISTQTYFGEVKPASAAITKFLVAAPIALESGIMTVLEALRLARQNGWKGTLGVYGRGDSDYIAQLRSFIINNQLPVEFLTVSHHHKDIVSMYRQHHALVHASEWEEPFSTRPLEAMACGLPVIATRCGGIGEMLRHRENALTYAAADAAELATCLQELQKDGELRQRIAETAQMEVISHYNEIAVIDRIENFLTSSIQGWESS